MGEEASAGGLEARAILPKRLSENAGLFGQDRARDVGGRDHGRDQHSFIAVKSFWNLSRYAWASAGTP